MLGLPPQIYANRDFETYINETFPDDAQAILDAYSPADYGDNNVSRYAHFQGDFLLRCGGRDMASLAAAAVGGEVYLYVFAQHTANDIGNGIIAAGGVDDVAGWASHTVEVPFVFGNLGWTYLGPAGTPATDAERALSRDGVMPRWLDFARGGAPGEDWTPVGDAPPRSMPALAISVEGGGVRADAAQQTKCDAIPRYDAGEGGPAGDADEPTAAPSEAPPDSAAAPGGSVCGSGYLGVLPLILVSGAMMLLCGEA